MGKCFAENKKVKLRQCFREQEINGEMLFNPLNANETYTITKVCSCSLILKEFPNTSFGIEYFELA